MMIAILAKKKKELDDKPEMDISIKKKSVEMEPEDEMEEEYEESVGNEEENEMMKEKCRSATLRVGDEELTGKELVNFVLKNKEAIIKGDEENSQMIEEFKNY